MPGTWHSYQQPRDCRKAVAGPTGASSRCVWERRGVSQRARFDHSPGWPAGIRGVLASHSVKRRWRTLRPACLSFVPAPLCLPSNPGFSLQGGLEKVHPQQEGGAGLAPAQGRGYAASIRDKSEQAWATFLLKPAPDWGVKGVTACMGTGTVSTHLAKVNHTERKLRPLKSVDRGGRCSSASSSLSGGWQPQRE